MCPLADRRFLPAEVSASNKNPLQIAQKLVAQGWLAQRRRLLHFGMVLFRNRQFFEKPTDIQKMLGFTAFVLGRVAVMSAVRGREIRRAVIADPIGHFGNL